MALENEITSALKDAMRAKDTLKLEALRAIKSALLLAKTQTGGTPELSEDDEIKLLQKLVKQRKESATIFRDQNRIDLAEPEEAQAQIITAFLPEQLSEEQITAIIDDIIATTGASSMKDMGQVMGMANQKMAGKADGKTIATVVKQRLS
ncbi:MAG: GatB/YqeY domain-containing protein [Bacteroidetes bacterium]|nr:GatB/YqeY domain-containing protein [Bacteroidota bacterium]MDA0937353.1 GatB/YqeY domain-containing protein [Bacteroidota bacterium]MDA1344779.1 GatB/YqeY domain-containing protein [Bacteroidota bacterium]